MNDEVRERRRAEAEARRQKILARGKERLSRIAGNTATDNSIPETKTDPPSSPPNFPSQSMAPPRETPTHTSSPISDSMQSQHPTAPSEPPQQTPSTLSCTSEPPSQPRSTLPCTSDSPRPIPERLSYPDTPPEVSPVTQSGRARSSMGMKLTRFAGHGAQFGSIWKSVGNVFELTRVFQVFTAIICGWLYSGGVGGNGLSPIVGLFTVEVLIILGGWVVLQSNPVYVQEQVRSKQILTQALRKYGAGPLPSFLYTIPGVRDVIAVCGGVRSVTRGISEIVSLFLVTIGVLRMLKTVFV